MEIINKKIILSIEMLDKNMLKRERFSKYLDKFEKFLQKSMEKWIWEGFFGDGIFKISEQKLKIRKEYEDAIKVNAEK